MKEKITRTHKEEKIKLILEEEKEEQSRDEKEHKEKKETRI